mgnify:CR=1 FL=1
MSTYTREQLTYLIQFIHPEKTLAALPGAAQEPLLAGLFGLPLATYRQIRESFRRNARQAAVDLLDDAALARSVDRLPFAAKSTVVCLGDSITDDYQSWAEILRHLLVLRRSGDGIRLINAGISGDMTTQMIARFLGVVLERPDWIFCMAGTNNARRHGHSAQEPLVSVEETARSLRALRHYAAAQTAAQWVWITPATVIEEKIAQHWWLGKGNQIAFRNEDLVAVADAVRAQPELVVDLQRVFGLPPDMALLLDDGLHPSLEGQKVIVRALIEALTA